GDGEKKSDCGECARQAAAVISGEGTFLAISRKSDEERTFFLKNGISSARTADRAGNWCWVRRDGTGSDGDCDGDGDGDEESEEIAVDAEVADDAEWRDDVGVEVVVAP